MVFIVFTILLLIGFCAFFIISTLAHTIMLHNDLQLIVDVIRNRKGIKYFGMASDHLWSYLIITTKKRVMLITACQINGRISITEYTPENVYVWYGNIRVKKVVTVSDTVISLYSIYMRKISKKIVKDYESHNYKNNKIYTKNEVFQHLERLYYSTSRKNKIRKIMK